MRLRKERSVAIVFDAVSISKDIQVIGGPLTLNFYVDSGSYVPNRFLTPLVLKPIIYVSDPNEVIPNGDKSEELVECSWFENDKEIISGDDYKINKDNTLTVLKNSTEDLVISYSAKWLDPRKKQLITIEDSVTLVCITQAESIPMPVLKLDKPLNWIHNPLKDERIYTIKAYVSTDKVYEGAVEWYCTYKNENPKLIDNTFLFYEGGQFTNKLLVNSAYMEDCIITAKNLTNDKLKEYYWFFNEKGNPLTYDEPKSKDIEGSNVFEVPEEALNTRANYNIKGLTLNQLVENGDFSNGDDKWYSFANCRIKNNTVTKKSELWGQIYRVIEGIENEDNIYIYYEFENTADSSIGSVKFGFSLSHNNHLDRGGEYLKNISPKEVVRKSFIIDSEKRQDSNVLSIVFPEREEEATIKVKYFGCINLTKAFGAGNEPTKEWCDEHIQGYFEGVKSVQSPIRIKSEIGRRNHIIGSAFINGEIPRECVYGTSLGVVDDSKTPVVKGTKVVKLEAVDSRNRGFAFRVSGNVDSHYVFTLYSTLISGIDLYAIGLKDVVHKVEKIDDTWYRIIINCSLKETSGSCFVRFNNNNSSIPLSLSINAPKIEEGDIPTHWTPAPEDNLPATGSNLYIHNQLELKSVGDISDYIENDNLHKNIHSIEITSKNNFNWLYTVSLDLKYSRLFIILSSNNLPKLYKDSVDMFSVYGDRKGTNLNDNVSKTFRESDLGWTFHMYRGHLLYTVLGKFTKELLLDQILDKGILIQYVYLEEQSNKIFPLNVSGKLITYPNRDLYVDYVGKFDSYYMDNIGFKFEGNKEDIVSIKSELDDKYYDTDSLKKEDNNYFTHPDIPNGTHLTIEYKTGPEIYGNNTISYISIKDVLDELWLEDVYTYKAELDEQGNVIKWDFVRLVDIDNYEDWLEQERISPYTLAPDGVIFGEYSADTKFLRQFPSSLYVDIILPNRLKDGKGRVKARALVGTKDGIVQDPERYFKITWLRRSLKAGEKDKVIGHGEEILIDIDDKSAISLEIEDIGILKALTDNKGKYLTDENNTILIGR